MLRTGLVGLPTVGKTTIFNLLTSEHRQTSGFQSGKAESQVGIARIPDRRVDFLSELHRPRKTTYAQIEFTEVPGLYPGSSQYASTTAFLAGIRDVDALVQVLRAFTNPSVPHPAATVDPVRDLETVNLELLLADLGVLENRIVRIQDGKRKKEQEEELAALERCRAGLEEGIPIHRLPLSAQEGRWLKNYAFLTEKPMILVVNVDEGQLRQGDYPGRSDLQRTAGEKGFPLLTICGQVEMEIVQLPPEDRGVFMADLGLPESGIERLASATYAYLGLLSFLTAGEDEVKAWTIRRGTTAKEAAGKIHSDIARGFIRAETIAFEDLKRAGSVARARDLGLLRLEGKDYLVQDGDIINFRFNV